MKKGLLSILAGALVVVGCQNYDDQFDSLESQINALASTVAGLSQVQSDLAALSGTVASLASTVNGLGSQIDTAVANGLADIQADIDAIETAVADVASSEEVGALSDAISDAQTDLDDLLAASSVFTGDVIVNSAQTLDAFHKMGAGLNIVNGNVDITVETSMDQAKVQELVDNILTTVKDFKYTSKASSIAETTFDNLTGTRSLTITQGGGIRFPNLVSATNIYLKDDFESTVGVIHFGSLTSVAGIDTDAEENTIRFTKATELHLTSLEYYPPATLTIETDEGAAMPFALDDLDADGDELEDGLTLSIKGPASVSISKIADGSITLEDVASATLTDFKGSVTLTGDVVSFTSNSLVALTVSAGAGVETVDVTGVADPDATTAAPSYGPAIDLDTLGDLETVTIAGLASSVNLGSNNNLTDVTISADVAGSITIDNNSDLSNVTLTGAKATALDVDTNADLTSLTVDLTWRKGTATAAKLDGDLDVTDNASLESLTVSSDNLENLEVTGNDELTTLDFTGVTKIGATGTAVVNIYDNDLTASKMVDSDDGTTDVANGKTGDKGSITSTSGMDTLSDYLTAVAADADSAAAVYFDTVESFVKEDDSEATDKTYQTTGAQPDEIKVLVLTAKNVTTPGADAIAHKRAFALDVSGGDLDFGMLQDGNAGDKILVDGSDAATTSLILESNEDLAIAQIMKAAAQTRATAFGVTLGAYKGAFPQGEIHINATVDSTTEDYSVDLGDGQTASASSADIFTLTIDGKSVTATALEHKMGTGAGANFANNVANSLYHNWTVKYGTSNSASYSESLFDVTTKTGGVIFIKAKANTGRRGYDKSYSISLTRKATNTATPIFGAYYGKTTAAADNKTISRGIIVTVESDAAGVTLDDAKTVSMIGTGKASFTLLTTTLRTNAKTGTSTAKNIKPTDARGDAVYPEGGITEVADPAVSFSRISWL